MAWFVGLLLSAAVPRMTAQTGGAVMVATENPSPRASVVVIEDPAATEIFVPQPQPVRGMIDTGLKRFTGRDSSALAWRLMIQPHDTVGIKVFSAPGEIIGTRPVVVVAVIESLLAAGIQADRIIVWDKYLHDLRLAGFFDLQKRFGIQVRSSADAKWDAGITYENAIIGKPIWGDHEFGRTGKEIGRNSHFSRLVTREITRHIIISPLLNHNVAGVSGNLMSLALGSVDNTIRFETKIPAMSEAVPEIFGHEKLFDRIALVIVDALICQYQGEENNLLHYAKVLNQLRFSKDPVALDVLSLHELEAQRKKAGLPFRTFPRNLYRNAALLELGIANPRHILVDHHKIDPFAALRR
jgi:hypothetical protein